MLDEQSGEGRSRIGKPRSGRNGDGWGMTATGAEYDDSGGASRFFYVAKPSQSERHVGGEVENTHATVKPVELMEYLIRLVTPPGGTVLDPFMGSGTTGMAALRPRHSNEVWSFVGIELGEDHFEIAHRRIAAVTAQGDLLLDGAA